MKNKFRFIKRLISIFLILLLSIENFAAVVSDNDGSAFVTKAEFDGLKNNFREQIEQYNISIDSKIDGAIASYLAGINLSKETLYKVEVSEWEKILQTNYVLPETWRMPSINLNFNFNYSSTDGNGDWYEQWWGTAGIMYDKPTSLYQVRNLVSAGNESTTYTLPNKVVWLGQSCDYEDTIYAVKTGKCASMYGKPDGPVSSYQYSYLYGATSGGSMNIVNALNLVEGYVKNRPANDVWASAMWWYYSDTFSYELKPTVDSDWVNKDLSTSISLNYVNNKQYKNEHIISWDDYSWNYMSDPTWTNSLGPNPSFSENDVLTNSSVTKKGNWAVFEMRDLGRSGTQMTPSGWESGGRTYTTRYQPKSTTFANYYSGSYNATRTNPIKSVGVLNKTYASTDIYQWKDKRKLIRDETKSIEKINLCNGVLIAYVKTDEIFKWEPVITGSYKNGTTDTPITKWRVKLSKKPFLTKDSVPAATDVLKNKGQTEDYLVTDTSTGKCKFEFELGEDTVIFCKWWPDDTTICNTKEWQGTLDLTQCGTYSIRAS